MQTKYKIMPLLPYLLFTFISFGFFIMACFSLTLIDSFSVSVSLFFLFTSITTLLIMIWGLDIKYLRINENKLVFTQTLGFSYKEYTFSEIAGFKTAIQKKKNRENLRLMIKTNAETVIEINDCLISNIEELKNEISKFVRFDNSIHEPIISLKDKALVLFSIQFFSSVIWFVISVF